VKVLGLSLMLAGLAGAAFGAAISAPEIDGSSAVAAVALIAGGLVVLRARKRR